MLHRTISVLVIIICLSGLAAAQFGLDKEYIRLYQRHLPQALLPSDAVRLMVEPKGLTVSNEIADLLSHRIEFYLSAGLPDVRIVSTNDAPLVIDCSVEVFQLTPSTFVHTELVYTKVGSHQEWDSKKKEYKTKDDYKNIPVDKIYLRLDGNSEVEYGLYDARSKRELDGDRISQPFTWVQENDSDLLSQDAARDNMIESLALQISGRVAPVGYPIKVKLAKNDKLKPGTRLLDQADDAGQPMPWTEAIKIWENMSGLSSKDEAYRNYNLAVAYEGLAYETPDANTSLQLLQKASDHYHKAQQMRTDEKYFVDPLGRIDQSIADAQQLRSLQAQRMAAMSKTPILPGSKHGSAKIQNTSAEKGTSEVLTNDAIVQLVKGGLADSVIIKKIKSAKCDFDTSTDALISLRKAGVSNQIISAMVEKTAD